MKNFISFLFGIFIFPLMLSAQYATEGNNLSLTLADLVANSNGAVVEESGYFVFLEDITISTTDTLKILNNIEIRIEANKLFTINGVFVALPPDEVIITKYGILNFMGICFENSSDSQLHNCIISYGGGIKIMESDIIINNCEINNFSTAYTSSAINLYHSSPVISNCNIEMNQGAAISSGANIVCAPQIIGNVIYGNNTANTNTPQINLGPSGGDLILIEGNTIVGNTDVGLTNQTGGISLATLVGGEIVCKISNNIIMNNRYGINLQGNNITSEIIDNQITDNNQEDNPMSGGSGISFYGNQTNTAIVARNIITGNLWGITIINAATPNLGNLETGNNEGLNEIHGNGNNANIYDIYNNTAGNIKAENNFWGTNDLTEIENHIYHQLDDLSLGLVDFMPINLQYLPYVSPGTGLVFNMQSLLEAAPNTITFDGENYIFHANVTLSEGDSWFVEQATNLLLNENVEIVIFGESVFDVENAATDSIVITSDSENGFGTIQINAQECSFTNTNISNGNAILINETNLILRNSKISLMKNIEFAISANNATLDFRSTAIFSNAGIGVFSNNSAHLLKNSIFSNNQKGGLFADNCISFSVDSCNFYNNTEKQLHIIHNLSGNNIEITNSIFDGNNTGAENVLIENTQSPAIFAIRNCDFFNSEIALKIGGNAVLTIQNSNFFDNNQETGIGLLLTQNIEAQLLNNVFRNNNIAVKNESSEIINISEGEFQNNNQWNIENFAEETITATTVDWHFYTADEIAETISGNVNFIPFFDPNPFTEMCLETALWSIDNEKYAIVGDTVIANSLYKKVFSHKNYENLTGSALQYTGAIRSDVYNKKVYFIKSESNEEFLIYNFNVEIGNVVEVYHYLNGNFIQNQLEVVNISTIDINGESRRYIEFATNANADFWIEGIGSTMGLLNAGRTEISPEDNLPTLLCFHLNSVLQYQAPNVTYCYEPDGVLTNNKHVDLQIFPTIVTNNLNIQSTFEIEEICVYSAAGQIIYNEKIDRKNAVLLNFAYLKQGIYFLKVLGKKQTAESKFLKH